MICHSFQTLSRGYDMNAGKGAVHVGFEFSEVTGSFWLPATRKLLLRFSERDVRKQEVDECPAQEEPWKSNNKEILKIDQIYYMDSIERLIVVLNWPVKSRRHVFWGK